MYVYFGNKIPRTSTGLVSIIDQHFSERLFVDALMTPVMGQGVAPFITLIDIAVLIDLGHFKLNSSYQAARQQMTKNKGCDYARMSCYEYMTSKGKNVVDMYPYCDSKIMAYPTPNHDYTSMCEDSLFYNVHLPSDFDQSLSVDGQYGIM